MAIKNLHHKLLRSLADVEPSDAYLTHRKLTVGTFLVSVTLERIVSTSLFHDVLKASPQGTRAVSAAHFSVEIIVKGDRLAASRNPLRLIDLLS